MVCRVGALAGVFALTTASSSARADDPLDEPIPLTVMVLTPDATGHAGERLARVIEAHLSDLEVEIAAVAIDAMPLEPELQAELVRAEAHHHEAVIAFWLSEDASEFYVLAPESDTEPEPLGIPDGEPGSAVWCDGLAAIVHSLVAPLLPEPPLDVDTPAATPPVPEPAPEPVEMAPTEPTPEPPAEPASRRVAIIANTGYTPALPDPEGPLRHGVRLGLGVAIGKYLGLVAGIDLFGRIRFETESNMAELAYWPIRIDIAAMAPIGDFEIGGGVGALVEVRQLYELDYELTDTETVKPHAYFGVSIAATSRYWVLRWLAIWLEAGADFFFKTSRYELGNDVRARMGAVRPRGVLGMTLAFNLTGGSR